MRVTPPGGVAIISACLKRAGYHNMDLFDATWYPVDKELETKINEHMLNTFYSEVENAGDERRTFWLEAFAISSNPNFRKIHLEAYNE